jgi:hypothetical protein
MDFKRFLEGMQADVRWALGNMTPDEKRKRAVEDVTGLPFQVVAALQRQNEPPTEEGRRQYPGPEHFPSGSYEGVPCHCTAACEVLWAGTGNKCNGKCGCQACTLRFAGELEMRGMTPREVLAAIRGR